MVVLAVRLEMIGEIGDPLGQDGDLDLRGAGIALLGRIFLDELLLALSADRHRVILAVRGFSGAGPGCRPARSAKVARASREDGARANRCTIGIIGPEASGISGYRSTLWRGRLTIRRGLSSPWLTSPTATRVPRAVAYTVPSTIGASRPRNKTGCPRFSLSASGPDRARAGMARSAVSMGSSAPTKASWPPLSASDKRGASATARSSPKAPTRVRRK